MGWLELIRKVRRAWCLTSLELVCLCGIFGLVVAMSAKSTAQQPEMIAEVDTARVYEGEPLNYKITLNHIDNPSPPDLSHFKDFSVQSAGETDLNSQQITIVNGVRTETIRRGRQYQYRLTPLKTGELVIPAPKANIAGSLLEGKPISIRVLAAEAQDTVLLTLSADRSRIYPTQLFTLTLNVSVKGLPSPANEKDPLTVQPEPPRLKIDWLDDDQLPKGIQPELPWQEVVQKLISRRGQGFRINSIRNSSAFSIFEDSSLAFHPRPQVVSLTDASGKQAEYWSYEFKRTFTAKSPGIFDFSAATIKGDFATQISRNRLQGESIFAKSDPISVEVRDVPTEGRPESYIGAIGRFSMVTELSPTTARVGDPMTLTISLNGSGTLEDAIPPDIQGLPEIQSNFRTYEGTSQTTEGSKRFTYSLRPLNANITELPPIPVSFFDADKEEFVTLLTDPISLNLSASSQLAAIDVVSSGSGSGNPNQSSLKISEEGLFANFGLERLRNDAITPQRWFIAWGILIAGVLLLNLAFTISRQRNADPRVNRRRHALAEAQKRIAQAQLFSQTDKHLEGIDSVRRAIIGLISDLQDLSEQGITVGEVKQYLDQTAVASDVRQAAVRLLEQCDAAIFGATELSLNELIPQATSLIEQLHRLLNQPLKRSFAKLSLMMLAVILSGCSPKADEQTTRLFLEAQQSYEVAKSSEDFQQSALRYQQIIDSGVYSGAVFFNQGNAWAKANQTGRAIAAYRQAIRCLPRDPYVKANLKATMSGIPVAGSSQSSDGILRYIYFWKNWFSLRELFLLETSLMAALLITASCVWLYGKLKRVVILLLIPTLAIAISCIVEWHDQGDDRRGVIIGPTQARKGDGDQYQPSFTSELPAGTEFCVKERRPDWVLIDISGIGSGWIRENQAIIY